MAPQKVFVFPSRDILLELIEFIDNRSETTAVCCHEFLDDAEVGGLLVLFEDPG